MMLRPIRVGYVDDVILWLTNDSNAISMKVNKGYEENQRRLWCKLKTGVLHGDLIDRFSLRTLWLDCSCPCVEPETPDLSFHFALFGVRTVIFGTGQSELDDMFSLFYFAGDVSLVITKR